MGHFYKEANMRKSRIFLAVAAVLAAMTVAFVSCAHNDDEKETSVQLSFRMMRALVDDETIEEEETGYTLTATIDGKEKYEQTKPVQIGKETAIEFKDVRANSKIRVHLRLRNLENETIYFGDSAEIIVKPGENNVNVTMHSSTIYVSEDGSDEKSGSSKESAMKTLESAFKKMSEISNDDIDWTIYVSGKISGTSNLESVSAKSVTITAKGDSAILDGGKETKDGATGSVLAIAENIEFPVTVSGITMQNGRSRIGAGFDMAGKGTATLIECTITDNEATNDGDKKANGGGIRVVNGSLVLKNTKVNNNKSEYNAGGIHFNGKELTMDDGSEISGNTAVYTAGGICVNNGVFTMNGGRISGNRATPGIEKTDSAGNVTSGNSQGGGIRLTGGSAEKDGGKMILIDGEISGNIAEGENGAGGGIDVTNGTLIVKGGAISANKAERRAGAILLTADLSAVTIEDGIISENEAVGVKVTDKTSSSYGQNNACAGAIFLTKGTLTISGGKITGNISNHNAGAINQDNGTFLMTGGEISGNTAMSNGGGIYINRSTFTMTGGKITKNKAVSYKYENASGEEKTQGGNGGGINMNRGTFIFKGGEISENEATKCGGGIFQNGKVDEGEAGAAITELRGGVIKNNTVKECGGGINISSQNAKFFMYSGEISGNKCTTDDETYSNRGGGIFCKEGTFTMSGGKISSNTATSNSKGGGIYIQKGNLSLSGKITISDNEANSASQIFVQNTASSATFEYNDDERGKTTLEFRHGKDENGNSYGNAELDMNITDGKLADESDTDALSRAFKLTSEDSEENSGTTSGSSGSTTNYTRDTTTWSEDDFIEAFTAAATATDPDATEFKLQGNVTLTKTFISSNYGDADAYVTINGQGKYGIEIRSSTASFKNVTFNNGAGSRVNGDTYQAFGMIYWNGGDGMLTFDSCSFSDSKTEGDVGGGALALFGKGSVTISACTFSRNSADHGAAIDIGGADRVSIEDSIFSENTAGNNCDIYCGGSEATVSGSGNISDFANPYQYYDDSKACVELFSETGTREQ